MKLSLPLGGTGQELIAEALGGKVILQVLNHGRIPCTAVLDTADCAGLIDTLGLMAVCAEEQAFDADYQAALHAFAARKPRELQPVEPAPPDVGVPVFLKRVPS